jgi:hypothetical protein
MTPLLLALALISQGRSSCLNQTYRVQAARAPAYYVQQSYAQNYVQPTYQIQERVIWVPVEGGSSSYPDSAYSAADLVGSRQRSQQQAGARVAYQQAVVDQLAGIRAELAAIKQVAGTDPGPPIPPTGPPVVPPGQPPPNPDPNQPPPPPRPDKPDAATVQQWTNDAVEVLGKRCLKCHQATDQGPPKSGFVIFGPDGKLALSSPLDLSAIGEQTRYLLMPKGGALSELEQSKLDNWIGLHLDEISAARRAALKAKAIALPPAAPLPASAPPPPTVPQPGAIRQ